MAEEVWNYVADGLDATGVVLAEAALAVVGTRVRVAPFDDDLVAKMGVWIRGERSAVEEVREALDAALVKSKVTFNAMRWEEAGRRG